jgi:outer membrane lipoprotein carrier protein
MKKILGFVFMLLCPLMAAAAEQDIAELRKLLDATKNLQGDFVQSLYDESNELQEESKGKFMMMRPRKFYWETIEPMPQILVSNDKEIWLYDPDLETASVRPFSDDLQQTPALILSEKIEDLGKQFSVSGKQEKNQHIFTLIPKVTDGMFQQLILVFEQGLLKEFSMRSNDGQSTRSILSNVKANMMLSEEKFNFKVPEGVEVTRQ